MMKRGKKRGQKPPSLLSLWIPRPASVPHGFLEWLGVEPEGRGRKRRREVLLTDDQPPAKRKRRRRKKRGRRARPLSPPPPRSQESWGRAEHVEPEQALPMDSSEPKPLVPYTPSPTPSPVSSRDPSPVPQPEPEPEPEEEAFDPSQHVELKELKVKNFGDAVVEKSWEVSMRDIGGHAETVMERVMTCLDYVVQHMLAGEDPETTAQLYVSKQGMYNGHKASKRAKIHELNMSNIMQKLEEVRNSMKPAVAGEEEEDDMAQTFWDSCKFVLVLRKRKPPVGSLYTRSEATPEEYAKAAHSLQDPSLKSYKLAKALRDSCLLNCTALGLEKVKHEAWPAKDRQAFIQGPLMKKAVEELAAVAGVPLKGPHDLAVLGRIQQHLGDEYQIAVYKGPELAFLTFGPNNAQHHVNLFYMKPREDEPAHIKRISSMSGFFSAKRFCELCKATTGAKHKCKQSSCRMCMRTACKSTTQDPKVRKLCSECNDTYKTEACFKAHQEAGFCEKEKRCLLCWEKFRVDKFPDHPCGLPFCKDICQRRHSPFEHCFVPTGNPEEDEAKEAMWDEEQDVLDFSPLQHAPPPEDASGDGRERKRAYADCETSSHPHTGELTVSLIVLYIVSPGNEPSRFVFDGADAGHKLIKEFRRKNSPFRNSTVWFHNGAKFDCHVLWRAAMEDGIEVDAIRNGNSILQMEFKGADVIIKDTILFLPNTPLSKFPDMFGLESGDKGHYPFRLTGTEKVDDRGNFLGEDGSRFPSFADFLPDGVRPKALKELRAWWEEEAAKYRRDPSLRYHLKGHELTYCEQDVLILMQGFEVFRAQWLQRHPSMDVNDSMTLPQFINRLYRKHFMKPNSISPLPPQGFLKENNKGSKEAYAWLQMMRQEFREAGKPLGDFRDGRRGGEVRISGLHVDGTGVDSTGMRHVFQFHGCWFHGCPKCAADKGKPRHASKEEAYVRTREESARLKDLSRNPQSPYGPFVYHEIWEHEFLERIKSGPIKTLWAKFMKSWPEDPLSIRDAFHGGRTNAVMHKIKVPKGWSLHYVDFTSLYPSINYGANGELYPVGFPKIFVGPDVEEEPDMPKLENAFGFWKVRVHPPRQLYFPVLPMTVNSKLVFPLCRTCAEEERQGLCPHGREERALKGTYFTEELKKAVELGYELDTPQEVWEWPKEQRTDQLFRKFIRELYAQKVLSSAKPRTEEEMEQVLEDVRSSVRLNLRPEDFKEDKCQRAQAKFAMNNIWGFHGKTGRPKETKVLKTTEQLEQLECNDKIDITGMQFIHGDHFLMAEFVNKVEKTWKTGSMAIAAMTTGWARLRLYELLQEYEQHVAYFDTDSAFLLLPPGVAPPPTSSRLGGLKDEIEETYGKGAYIANFISLGPKCYAYDVFDRHGNLIATEFKLKGVGLTAEALKRVSMDLMADLAEHKTKETRIKQWNITRNLIKAGLYSHHFTKRLGFSSTKRFFLPEGDATFKKTLPYGYTYDHRDPKETQAFLNLFPMHQ